MHPLSLALPVFPEPKSFDRYKTKKKNNNKDGEGSQEGEEGKKDAKAVLTWPGTADKSKVSAAAASTFLVRDLITTPCEHMGPQHLEVGIHLGYAWEEPVLLGVELAKKWEARVSCSERIRIVLGRELVRNGTLGCSGVLLWVELAKSASKDRCRCQALKETFMSPRSRGLSLLLMRTSVCGTIET